MQGRAIAERPTAGTPSLLRAMNERAVLELIHKAGPMAPSQVVSRTGLSKPTVYLALTGLVDAGLLRPAGRTSGGPGPRAPLYEVNPLSGRVVGIHVGRQWTRAAIADISGAVLARRDERTRGWAAPRLVAQIGQIAHRLAADAGIAWGQVTQAALGTPGVFVPRRDRVALTPNLPGLGRLGLLDAVRRELGTTVNVENDVNLAALGEQAVGGGRGVANFVYLWVGTGVGMGLILDHRLYRGATGAAGEIGYLPVGGGDPHDSANRRRGTFEGTVAAAALVRSARELGLRAPLSARTVFALARRGDPAALEVVQLEARRLALGLASVVPVIDPELVILGGGIGYYGDLLVEPLAAELSRISPFQPRLEVSRLGDYAVLQGAIATALDEARERIFSRGSAHGPPPAGP